jgi:transcriptional regulator with XRE-family HTH domain
VSDPQNGRVGFGNRLRRLRQDAELSGKQLAERLGWPASKVSRLEHGRQTASIDDVRAWAAAVAAPEPVRDELVADLRSLRVEYATWRRQLRSGFAPRQRAGRVLEAATSLIRAVETALVPGLLQTADYARHVYHGLATLRDGPYDIEAAVQERMRRQEVLYESDRRFRFLLTEAVLRTRVCPPAVLRAQLDRLLAVSGLDNVDVAVIPFTTSVPKAPTHGFWIFDDTLVLVETVNAELAIRDPDDVALYERLFEMYWEVADQGPDAARLITAVAVEL